MKFVVEFLTFAEVQKFCNYDKAETHRTIKNCKQRKYVKGVLKFGLVFGIPDENESDEEK